ncbi:hypothetical protein BDK92_1522 [Micromonospora pisi]|uniref:Uncharacterized protein n=1 Tax=Micromonospora pisi TaxID=589240 RepID=A0A495JFD2_9ACTN|nr:hypothetical protein [Micromonospora pisi]RKR87248.1 hypothetical protein BDK92_1522 [Micromonospora pisi]
MSTPASATPRRRGLWRRFVEWLFGTDETPEPPRPEPVTPVRLREVSYQPSDSDRVFTPLCLGDVFEFQVHADLVWSTDAITYTELVEQAKEYGPSAHDTVRERVWRVARTFSPYHAADAEAAIQQELDQSWCYSRDDQTMVRCTAKVRVLPDPRVRQHLLPAAMRELDTEAQATLGRLRAARVEEITERWRALLDELGHGPAVVHAAQLTEPAFAAVLQQLTSRRRASAMELVDVLRQATKDHENVGLFEFANAYDTALQAFRKEMGLEPGAWFNEPDGSQNAGTGATQ